MAYRSIFASVMLLGLAAASGAVAAPDGATVFKQRCAVCHSLEPAPGKMGPPLAGVVGRKSATLAGYAYSPGMQKAKLTWTPQQLDTYLKAPGQTVPGTKMVLALPDAEQRAAVIAYLGTTKK